MNNLDKKILDLFRNIINSGTKYLTAVKIGFRTLEYKINEKDICIHICYLPNGAEFKSNSYSSIDSIIKSYSLNTIEESYKKEVRFTIYIESKTYYVPELGRVEQAETLDKIDNTIKEYESGILDNIISEFEREEF